MDVLPKWASVALIARCAEIVSSAFDTAWPNAPNESRELFLRAIRGAQSAAETGCPSPKLAADAEAITRLVGRFEYHLQGVPVSLTKIRLAEDEEPGKCQLDDAQLRVVRDLIDVAARAARAADAADREEAFSECRDGLSWSYSVITDLGASDLAVEIDDATETMYHFCTNFNISDGHTIRWTTSGWQS